MLRAMASALAGSVGSIAAPLASLNQLATSTAIVKFFVSLASVTGGSNLIAISASISEVKVKSWVVLLASVKTPVTLTLRSEEHTSELQSHSDLVCRLLLEKKKQKTDNGKGERSPRARPSDPRPRLLEERP